MSISSISPQPLVHETPPSTTPHIGSVNLSRCVREVYVLMLASLRGERRSIDLWREIDDRRQDELTNEQAQTHRSLLPQVLRVASAAFGVIAICSGVVPKNICPLWLKGLGKGSGTAQGILKLGLDAHQNYQTANLTEIEAQIKKFQNVGSQMTNEAQDRRKESNEVLRLIQDIDSQIARAIAALSK